MVNSIIRKAALERHVRLWQVAERVKMTDGMFSRHLRHELPEEERALILRIIDELAIEREVD